MNYIVVAKVTKINCNQLIVEVSCSITVVVVVEVGAVLAKIINMDYFAKD